MAGYRTIVAPLTRQLRKDAYQWDDAAESTFSASFIVETDAFGTGVGPVLTQGN